MKLVVVVFAVIVTLTFAQTFCGPCQIAADVVADYLTLPDRDLIDMMEKLCTKLPTAYQTQCKAAVAGFGQQGLRIIRETFRDGSRAVCQRVGACNAPVLSEVEIKEKANLILEKSKKLFSLQKDECNLDELRELYYWLPPSWKLEIKSQLVGNILGQFPRLKYEVVEKLVNDMFDTRVPAQRVCKDIDDILIPEARRRQMCSQRCMEQVDLSPERILKVVMQCQFDFRCYLNEVAKEMQNIARCAHECYMNEPIKAIKA